MSSIGSGGISFSPLVSSLAGVAQRQDPDQAKGIAAAAKFQHDLQELTENLVGDVGESDSTGDRDADGRMAWSFGNGPSAESQPENSSGSIPRQTPHRVADANGELGGRLDLEA